MADPTAGIKITRPDEVYLFGSYFPIIGKIKKELASTWPQKQVTGDYTKDSEKYVSSVIWSDQRGGIGLKQMSESKPEDALRSWWSTCEGGYKGHLLLPQLPVLAGTNGNPTATLDDPVAMFEFGNVFYAVFGTSLRSWAEGSASWSASLRTLSQTPTDVIVSGAYVYFAVGTQIERFNPVANTWFTCAVPSRWFLRWDAKLLVVDNTGLLSYTVNDGVTWTANAQSDLQAGSFNGLTLYVQSSSNTTIPALGTKQGMYFLDFDGATWNETTLANLPKHDYLGLGMVMWRGDLYVSAGLGVYRYSPTTGITPMGLDKDYGLPAAYRGNIIKLIAEHNHLFALMDATAEAAQDMFSGSMLSWDSMFNDNEGYSAIFEYNGVGWQPKVTSGLTDAAVKCGIVATADDNYRLWYGMNKKVYYLPLKRDIQNPLEVPEHNYANYAEHYYPIFDADNSVVTKNALNISLGIDVLWPSILPPQTYSMLYYSVDEGITWTLMVNDYFTDGKVYATATDYGQASWPYPLASGLAFNSIQFKILAYTTTTYKTLSPDIRFLRLDYMKVPDTRYQYSFVVDCRRDYRHKRASTLATALETAKTTTTLGDFMYRSYPGVTESKKVSVLNMKGSDETGKIKEGVYQITVLEP